MMIRTCCWSIGPSPRLAAGRNCLGKFAVQVKGSTDQIVEKPLRLTKSNRGKRGSFNPLRSPNKSSRSSDLALIVEG